MSTGMFLDEARVGGLMRDAVGVPQRGEQQVPATPEDLYQAYAEADDARAAVKGLQNDLKEAREQLRDAEGRVQKVYEQLRRQRAAQRAEQRGLGR